jgi:hypothetical protein
MKGNTVLQKLPQAFFVLCLCCCCAFAVSCVPRASSQEQAPAPDDFVKKALGGAAETAHGELAMLARLRGEGLQPLLPPPDPALAERIDISWSGPADGALKQICLQVGYRFRAVGTPSAQPLVVIVRGTDRAAYALIEDIAWQVQPQAIVQVDSIGRIITLARTIKGDK